MSTTAERCGTHAMADLVVESRAGILVQYVPLSSPRTAPFTSRKDQSGCCRLSPLVAVGAFQGSGLQSIVMMTSRLPPAWSRPSGLVFGHWWDVVSIVVRITLWLGSQALSTLTLAPRLGTHMGLGVWSYLESCQLDGDVLRYRKIAGWYMGVAREVVDGREK